MDKEKMGETHELAMETGKKWSNTPLYTYSYNHIHKLVVLRMP